MSACDVCGKMPCYDHNRKTVAESLTASPKPSHHYLGNSLGVCALCGVWHADPAVIAPKPSLQEASDAMEKALRVARDRVAVFENWREAVEQIDAALALYVKVKGK